MILRDMGGYTTMSPVEIQCATIFFKKGRRSLMAYIPTSNILKNFKCLTEASFIKIKIL